MNKYIFTTNTRIVNEKSYTHYNQIVSHMHTFWFSLCKRTTKYNYNYKTDVYKFILKYKFNVVFL